MTGRAARARIGTVGAVALLGAAGAAAAAAAGPASAPTPTIMRRWYSENRNGNVSTADSVALVERVSRSDLGAFFDVWLYRPVKPTTW